MLDRLRRAREALLMAILGDLDILSVDEFSLLRRLVDVETKGSTEGTQEAE